MFAATATLGIKNAALIAQPSMDFSGRGGSPLSSESLKTQIRGVPPCHKIVYAINTLSSVIGRLRMRLPVA